MGGALYNLKQEGAVPNQRVRTKPVQAVTPCQVLHAYAPLSRKTQSIHTCGGSPSLSTAFAYSSDATLSLLKSACVIGSAGSSAPLLCAA